ncbi:kinase-like domain-containing protein, partial [Paraphysoderma sedebokerense]
DLIKLCGIGHGNGGTVDKVLHSPTGTIMARKTITIDQEFHETLKKQIRRELNILSECCNCQFIVKFFGAFVGDGDISICMEYMDLGSLDGIYRKIGKIPEPIIGQITISILEGLVYLYQKHKIIHRDIKPSNILFNSQGQIKLCDFGVSGEALLNSLASTFVGTDAYMSPERLQSKPYATQSDTWSMGITLMELALGKYPF